MPSAPKQQPFQWTPVRIPFSGGVDTRSERKAVPPLKLGLLENAVFTTPGVLRKRFGYEKLASLALDNLANSYVDQAVTNARALMTRGNSLWLRGAEDIYSLSPDRKRWQREAQVPSARFVYGPRLFPMSGIGSSGNAERATANGVTMLAHDIGAVITAIFYDGDGTELARTSFAGLHGSAAVVGTTICLFYGSAANDQILMAAFDTVQLRTSNRLVFSVSTIAADLNTTNPRFDVAEALGQQILVAYNTTTANTLKFGYVTPAGTLVGAMSTIATTAAPTVVACAVEPTAGTLLVCWRMTGATSPAGQMFTAAKAALFAAVSLGAAAAQLGFISCVFRDAVTAEVFFDRLESNPGRYHFSFTSKATCTTAGVVVQFAAWLRHASLASKPWLVNGRVHVLTLRPDSFGLQRSWALVASGGVQDPMPLGTAYANEAIQDPFLSQVKPLRPDRIGATVWLTPKLLIPLDASGVQYFAANLGVDYSHSPTFIEAGGATYFTGTSLWMLDGANVVESGFQEFPALDNGATYVTQSTTGGALVSGSTYSYRFYYEWRSATGEVFQSTTGGDVVVALIGGHDTIAVAVPTLTHTLKSGVFIACYRTLAGQSLFHRVASIPNDPTLDTVTMTDTLSDALAAVAAFDPRDQGELANLSPPPGTVPAIGNTRAFLAGFEDPNLVVASKLRFFGIPLSWSPALQIQLPEAAGAPITALAALGDALVAFRTTKCYIIGGDGPDNTGSSGSFAPPRVLSDDIGCTGPGSIVRTPLGLMFKSQRGIYLLGLDGGLSYIGADVERYNNDTVTAAVSLPDRHEARFVLASGNTLVFDYLAKQWSVFTVGGLHAVIWKGRHVYLPDAAGAARAELAGSFLDDGQSYGWALEMAWLYVGDNQNQQMVKCLQFLGEFMGDHSAIVQIAYDYEQAYSDRIVVDMSAVLNGSHFGDDAFFGKFLSTKAGTFGGNIGPEGYTATGVYQFKVFPFRRRCQAIKVRWEEARRVDPAGVIQYAWNEGARLNELALEVGLRGGLWQPGNDRTFGG